MFGVGSASDGPPQSGVAHGFNLIPVGSVADEAKTGRKAENSRKPRSDMMRGWDDFRERHTEPLKHLEPMYLHWMKCAKCDTQREKCAHACAR